MFRAKSTIAAALVAASVFAVSASSASAWTWDHTKQNLTFPSEVNRCLAGRTLQLRGTYQWSVFGGIPHQGKVSELPLRTYRLRGKYQMMDCIYSYNADGTESKEYRHVSKLVNLRNDGQLSSEHILNSGDGKYHWGSKLRNVRGL